MLAFGLVLHVLVLWGEPCRSTGSGFHRCEIANSIHESEALVCGMIFVIVFAYDPWVEVSLCPPKERRLHLRSSTYQVL